MWVFSKFGFFSVVAKFDEGQPKDKPLQIRTRWDSHIDRLRKAFPFLSEPATVTRGSDYSPRRVYASHEEWGKVLAGMSTPETLAYGNFKGAMDNDNEFRKDGLANALHSVWSVVHRSVRI